jgi:hypothetical protein
MKYKIAPGNLAEIVATSDSFAQVIKKLEWPLGGRSYKKVQEFINQHNLDMAHFKGQGHRFGVASSNRKTAEKILVLGTPGSRRTKVNQLRRAMLESGLDIACVLCDTSTEWNGKYLMLEVDHINGEPWDNRLENLRFLCPNCHSQQTETNKSWKRSK